MLVAPSHHSPPTKAAVPTEDDSYIWPNLPETLDQQAQNRPGMMSGTDITGTQIGAQQLAATEHIQGQETVFIVIPVEEAPFLVSMKGIIGGVKIQNEFLGRLPVRFDELFHHQ